jgi:uncharacterized YigZ family protein
MAEAEYRIPASRCRVEQVVERSRFITTLAPAASPEAARAFIDELRQEFADATHNCWAFVAGEPGSTRYVGMSDDGEPHGTAGRPMLNVLLHSGVGEIAAVVTRYYGGTKLGRGGLMRAYGGGVQHALDALATTVRVSLARLVIVVGYADADPARRLLAEHGATVAREDYGAEVVWDVLLPEGLVQQFSALLADRTAGRARTRVADDEEEGAP